MNSLALRIVLRTAILPVFVVVFILWPAGTFDFWRVYAFFLALLIPMIAGAIYFFKHDPAVLERRLKSREREDTQKAVIAMMTICVIACYMIPGFDKRFGWSDVPAWLSIAAIFFAVLSYLFMLYVMKVNSFAARTIEVEQEQQLIDTGPYGIVRHPMYTGALLLFVCTPIALGSWWALLAVVPIPACLAVRALNEEEVLQRELSGYGEYMRKVSWRLLPGVW